MNWKKLFRILVPSVIIIQLIYFLDAPYGGLNIQALFLWPIGVIAAYHLFREVASVNATFSKQKKPAKPIPEAKPKTSLKPENPTLEEEHKKPVHLIYHIIIMAIIVVATYYLSLDAQGFGAYSIMWMGWSTIGIYLLALFFINEGRTNSQGTTTSTIRDKEKYTCQINSSSSTSRNSWFVVMCFFAIWFSLSFISEIEQANMQQARSEQNMEASEKYRPLFANLTPGSSKEEFMTLLDAYYEEIDRERYYTAEFFFPENPARSEICNTTIQTFNGIGPHRLGHYYFHEDKLLFRIEIIEDESGNSLQEVLYDSNFFLVKEDMSVYACNQWFNLSEIKGFLHLNKDPFIINQEKGLMVENLSIE